MTTAIEAKPDTDNKVVLRTLQQADLIPIFTADGIEPLIEQIEREARSFCFDIATEDGKAGIKSLAYTISRAKTAIDGAGKNLVADIKNQAAKVDEARRLTRDRLDVLKEEIRQPLTDWEAAEERRAAEEKLKFEIELAWNDAIEEDELRTLRKEKESAEQAQREADELARKVAEDERRETERVEREEKIRKDAEDRARKEAEEKARQELEASARREADAQAALDRAETDRIFAEQKAEREKEKAVEDERRRAADVAQKEKEEREKKERDRKDAEETERLKAERLANHKAHRAKIQREVIESLINTNLINESTAMALMMCFDKKEVKHIQINY